MNILFYHPFFTAQEWLDGMAARLPGCQIRQWQPGDNQPADYALVWRPPYEMLSGRRDLKGIFVLGAGVDAIIDQERQHPGTLPTGVPLVRLEDTGMGLQMQEYALATALRYFRRMDEYQLQQQQALWRPLQAHALESFTIGIMGAGVLGRSVAQRLVEWGFPVRCWSRTPKQLAGIESFAGDRQLPDFLQGVQLLINLLPNTPETVGILNRQLFAQLNANAYLINLARGVHLVEDDLLDALTQRHLAAATLDVLVTEPLPQSHPFWQHPRIAITPHVAAFTLPQQAMDQIVDNIATLERGAEPVGLVDIERGY